MRLLLSLALMLVISLPAVAEEFVYSPEGCEFKMVFPDEPYATRRCHDQMTDKCNLMTSFTQVFGLDATINFYVSCTPAPENFRKEFTTDLLRTTLMARPYVNRLEVYDTTFDESEEALVGSLLGAGPSPSGNDPMLYVTQLWIGDKSVLTLEAELIGDQHDEADQLFADILRSLQYKKPGKDTDTPPRATVESEGEDTQEKDKSE